jgi:hypothetical protein
MTPDERRTRVAWLEELGVPASFHDAIIDAPNDWLTAGGAAAPALAMIAVSIGVMVAAFRGLDDYVEARAAAEAAQNGASLVYTNVGLGVVVLLFGMIALSGWACSMFAARYRVKGFPSAAAAGFRPPPAGGLTQRLAVWLARRNLTGPVRRAAAAATVNDFLLRVVRDGARPWGIAAAVLVGLAIVLTAAETNSFWVAGPAGIVEHTMFAPFSSRHYALGEVTALTTGCNHTDDDESLIYDVMLPSGEEFGLGAQPTKAVGGSKASAIEAIDAQIRRRGNNVEHRRWSHLDRDPVHAQCLVYWARQFGRDGVQRLAALLRLTADETRRWPMAASSIRTR